MGKVVKNYIYNILYQLLVLIIPLVTAPYLTRTLGADNLGKFSYVNSMTALICTFVMLGIYNYGNRQVAYVRDDPKKLDNCFWKIMSARLIIAVFGTIIFAVVVILVNRYIKLFIIYYTYLLAYFIDCTWLYVGVEDMKWAVIKNLITKVISVAGIFLFVNKPEDIWIYVLIQGGSILVSNSLAYSQLYRFVGKPKVIFEDLKIDLQGSFLLFLPSIATTLYTQCDKIMIEMMTGDTSQVAFYDYSEKIVTIPLTFITVLSTVMMPRIANEFKKEHFEKISSLLCNAAKISMMIAFPMMFGLAVVADKLIPWYLGDEFLPTIQAIIVICPIILTNTLSGISGRQYFTAVNRVDILIRSQFAAAIGNIIVNALLIPVLGFKGAAVATVFCSTICAGVQMYYLNLFVKMKGLLLSSIKYCVFSILMSCVVKLLTFNMPAVPATNVIQILIGIIVYILLCLISRDKQFMELLSRFPKILKRNS